MTETFAEKLQRHRTRLKLTRKSLADLIGYSERIIYKWERGAKPKPATQSGVLAILAQKP